MGAPLCPMLRLFILRDRAPVGVWIRVQLLRRQHAEQYAELRKELVVALSVSPDRRVDVSNTSSTATASLLTELEYISASVNDHQAHQ